MQICPVEKYLSEFPPHLRPTALERGVEIQRYLTTGKRNLKDHDAVAARLNIKRRKLYGLITDFEKAQTRSDLDFRHGFHSPIDQSTYNIMDKTIQARGESTPESIILAEFDAECASQGVPAPSLTAVRTRMSRTPTRPALEHRLTGAADMVIDGCQLDLFAINSQQELVPVYLSALIDVGTGATLAHELTSSPPNASTALTILLAVEATHRRCSKSLMLASNMNLTGAGDMIELAAQRLNMCIDVAASKKIPKGRALIATFGRRIGRIPFCQRRQPTFRDDAIRFTPIRGVVVHLINRRNALLQDHGSAPPAASM